MTTPQRTVRRPRRRAMGMDAGAVAEALEEGRFDARQDSRHEDLADGVCGPAQLAEWESLAQLLADAAPGTIYDPDTDDVVQAEQAADAAARRRPGSRARGRRRARRVPHPRSPRGPLTPATTARNPRHADGA
ncbi:hypothetical protein OG501_37785 [Streptomyces niveus]|uniref:hypothetical protein n=1 Tax=Streptomyces niveus TaxID=193462 RepID=UPI003863ADBD